mmetsp:Transcript_7811/g.13780  ORF Transcript_7811/g.13780 Transcript_7811/m.13780 type:complete len:217 (-) Transcript_7811:1033-1683(-)
MGAEKWLKGARLVPTLKELCIRVPEKPTNVSSCKSQASRVETQEHVRGDLEVTPLSRIVSSPNGAVALRASKKRTREYKAARRSTGVPFGAADEAFCCCHMLVKTVQVMPLSVLNAIKGERLLVHGDLRAVENGGFVHVVPRKQTCSAAFVFFKAKLVGPPRAHFGMGKVQVRGISRPAPTIEVLGAALIFDVQPFGRGLGVNIVFVVTFDMRVYN